MTASLHTQIHTHTWQSTKSDTAEEGHCCVTVRSALLSVAHTHTLLYYCGMWENGAKNA